MGRKNLRRRMMIPPTYKWNPLDVKPHVVVSDSKNLLHGMREAFNRPNNGLLITADDKNRKALVDINAAVRERHHVGLSPAVESGVSIIEDRPVIGMFAGVIAPESMLQMLRRVRPCREYTLALTNTAPPKYVRTPKDQIKHLCKVTRVEVATDYDHFVARRRYATSLRTRLGTAGFFRLLAIKGARLLVSKHVDAVATDTEIRKLGREATADIVAQCRMPYPLTPLEFEEELQQLRQDKPDTAEYYARHHYAQKLLAKGDITATDILWLNTHEQKLRLYLYTMGFKTPPDEKKLALSAQRLWKQKVKFMSSLLERLDGGWVESDLPKILKWCAKQPVFAEFLSDTQRKEKPRAVLRSTLELIGARPVLRGHRKDRYSLDFHRVCGIHDRAKPFRGPEWRGGELLRVLLGDTFKGRAGKHRHSLLPLFKGQVVSVPLTLLHPLTSRPNKRVAQTKTLLANMIKNGLRIPLEIDIENHTLKLTR